MIEESFSRAKRVTQTGEGRSVEGNGKIMIAFRESHEKLEIKEQPVV